MDLRVLPAARLADALLPGLLPRPVAIGMRLDAGAVEAEADDLLADRFLLPMGPPAARERRFWTSGGTGRGPRTNCRTASARPAACGRSP